MVEPDNLRYTKIAAQQRIRRDPRARIWHIDSRPRGNQNRDQGGAGSRISPARRCGTLPK